jgi:hypothetical protein
MARLVRLAGADDAGAVGQLLYEFNREFDEPTPAAPALAGFTNRTGGPDGPVMFVYERDL